VLRGNGQLTRPRAGTLRAAAVLLAAGLAAGCAGPAASPAASGRPSTAPSGRTAGAGREAIVPAAAASTRAPAPSASPGHRTPSPSPAAAPLAGTTVPGAPDCPLFPADNVWNTDISALPVAPQSAAWLASMDAAGADLHPDFGPDPGGYPYGIPVTVVTGSHPLAAVSFTYGDESDRGPYPFGPDTLIEGGPQAGGDRHAIMINSETCVLYELWNARYAAAGATAGSGASWNLRSNALRPAGWTSADAAGLPVLPGLLSYAQVQAAVAAGRPLTHAIRLTAARTQSAFIWPARHAAGSGTGAGLPPMGARFRLAAGFDVAGFCTASTPYCADARAVLVELQHYGLILADNGSNWFFGGSAFPAWPDGLISLLKGIPARAFQAVSESCLMVAPDSGQASAKPGCPIG
jgi:hypothetical protein